MRKVILESPFAPSESFTVSDNEAYARQAVRDALLRGEAPLASHLLYTQPGILIDTVPGERKHGIDAGHAWLDDAEAMVVYTDNGISSGMRTGIARAEAAGLEVEYRSLVFTVSKKGTPEFKTAQRPDVETEAELSSPSKESVPPSVDPESTEPKDRSMTDYLQVNAGRSWPRLVIWGLIGGVCALAVIAVVGPLLNFV